jgi:hypothetical protein
MLKEVRERLEETMADMRENMRLLNFKIGVYEEIISESSPEKT